MDQIAGERGLQYPMDKATGQEKDQMVLKEDHQDLNGKKMVRAKYQEQGLERDGDGQDGTRKAPHNRKG